MANTIRHQGIVENIDGTHLCVRIIQTSACSTCSIKGHCSSADTKEKLIDVENYYSYPFNVGEQVWVIGKMYMGALAVLYAFILPFIIVLISLFLFHSLFHNDLYTALVSLAVLIPYYWGLHLCDRKIVKKFVFTVEPMNETQNNN